MAEVDTQLLTNQHADIRREAAEHTAELRYNMAERSGDIRREVAAGIDKTGDLVASTASDIRLEQQRQAFELSRQIGDNVNEIVKEGLKGDFNTVNAVKDGRYETVSRVEASTDRLDAAINNSNFNLSSRVENAQDRNAKDVADLRTQMGDRFFTVARDTQDIRAQIVAQQQQVVAGFAGVAKDTELAALKGIIEAQKNTQYLADKIGAEGDRTRGLINDLKYHDLNRGLVERNAELVEERHAHRHWRHAAEQNQFGAQFAQLQSMMQNFNSQLADTRQGMVNFGTMAGVGQSSTSNNVR
jgi:hypothetical protein